MRTPAGVPVGRVNYCICPNGQALRAGGAGLPSVGIEPLKVGSNDGLGPMVEKRDAPRTMDV